MKALSFAEWIEEFGKYQLCIELGVTARTVEWWLAGNVCPSIAHLKAIKKLSEGRITYARIIDSLKEPRPRAVNKKRQSA